ncbi:hypothetical protein H0H81_004034 [Sphagnurus paluster]|uniref:Uncharacterized protein n=1 Tax=Sphagnurus paluster TaxID=117069 RepID=A0A9P7FT00_9AGAR|nr:hypothetical protein H0H81_004034 [Sphagnurus paluster]
MVTALLAPVDVKAIGASFSQLITTTMVSRLVLNLRSASTFSSEDDSIPTNFSVRFMINTIGNLGGDLETILDDVGDDAYEAIPMQISKMDIAEVI